MNGRQWVICEVYTRLRSSMRLRLRPTLQVGCAAITIYLVTHLYISYKLSSQDTSPRHPRGLDPRSLPCAPPPSIEPVIDKLPHKPREGVFFVPTYADYMKPSATVPVAYAVDQRFPPLLSNGETEHSIRLVRKLSSLLIQANITFSLWQGSLLGSYMTHGILPWDEDIDIAIQWSDMPKVKAALRDCKSMWKTYNVTSSHEDADLYSKELLTTGDFWAKSVPNLSAYERYHRFKFFSIDSLPAGNATWKWPNIDVVYYKENATHLWTFNPPSQRKYVHKDIYFPLHQRPFGSLWLPAPRDTHSFLRHIFGSDFQCTTPEWNHRLERVRTALDAPCCALYWTYPVVLREEVKGGVIETLVLGNETLHSAFVKESFISKLGPYRL